ncbi:MAG: UDP-N-acetyl glucosamine 2-epimerase [Saccharofermentans sp.]|nr:UDP-N-acetyl glucosamine 2-epimerase [Saccharofermentans sp.]
MGLVNRYRRFVENNRSVKSRFKKVGKKIATFFLYPWIKVTNIRFSEVYSKINRRINQFEKMNLDTLFATNRLPYVEGEPIRIVFVYQVASFWPSWDLFYHSVKDDPRFDVKFLWLDETVRENVQMQSSHEFIDSLGIDYYEYYDFNLNEFAPHILVLQTPYDNGHRKPSHRTKAYKQQGYRVVYFPYGIEITDTSYSREAHFLQGVPREAWRIYTFSERMAKDYRLYCPNGGAARGLGSPRLDALLNKESFPLPDEVTKRINNRKVVLWKVHFPKIVKEHGKVYCATPDLDEYIKFAKEVSKYEDLFFIFLPHPKFLDPDLASDLGKKAKAVVDTLTGLENVYIDKADDYRPSLVNADIIMSDRSAVLIEAATVGVPVMFLYNEEFQEAFTEACSPIVDSYKKGTTAAEMIQFVEDFRDGKPDENAEIRKAAYDLSFNMIDGNSCERIKDDMIKGIKRESH